MSKSILIATPCYDGQLHWTYHRSVLEMSLLARERKIGVGHHIEPGQSIVTRARNRCVAEFRRSEFTHLLFIDARIGFHAEAAFKMLECDAPVIAGVCPKKEINMDVVWQAARQNIPAGEIESVGTFKNIAMEDFEEGGKMTPKLDKRGVMPVDYAGTGFMLIERSVFDRIEMRHPELVYDEGTAFFENRLRYPDSQRRAMMENKYRSQRYMGEDYSFCVLCHELKIQVLAWAGGTFTHAGMHEFKT